MNEDNIEIKNCKKIVNGEEVDTKIAEITNANILEVEAGTNGYHGGDTGHGCRTYFRIKDLASTDMEVKSTKDRYGASEVEVTLGGDTELETFIQTLEFALQTLKKQENLQDQ